MKGFVKLLLDTEPRRKIQIRVCDIASIREHPECKEFEDRRAVYTISKDKTHLEMICGEGITVVGGYEEVLVRIEGATITKWPL